jgi:PAS domain S-box-containing protein
VTASATKLRGFETGKLAAWVVILAAGLSLAIISLTAYEIHRQRRAVLDDASSYLTSMTLTMAEQTEQAFAAADKVVDAVLEGLPDQLEKSQDAKIYSRLKDLVIGLPVIDTMGVFDHQGRSLAHSRIYPAPAANIADREYFKTLAAAGGRKTVITAPLVSRLTGKTIVFYATRISGPDGAFRGVVTVGVNPGFFRDSFRVALIRPGSTFALFRSDATLLVRHPHAEDAVGKSFSQLKLFKELVPKTPAGTYEITSSIDNAHRLVSYRLLGQYPLLINSSFDMNELLAEWRKNAWRLGGGASASVLLLLTLLMVILRQLRRQAVQAKALEQSEAHYRTLYNDTPVMLHSIDADMRIINVSDYWLGKMGYSREEVLGKRSSDFMTPESREITITESLPKFIRDGKVDSFAIQMVTKSGELLDILLSAVAQYAEPGKFKQSLSVLIDVTERNRLDTELHKTLEDLGRSNADLEQFAYVASHDLQEPLRMVSTYVQLLARRYKGQLDADADDFIGFAAEGAQRMSRMIAELMEYSRIHSETHPFVSVDLNNVARVELDNLRVRIDEEKASVEVAPLPTVLGDHGQLVSLFQNLIGNGLKYTREGVAPHIHISTNRLADYWHICVADNGIGIESEYLEKIFRLFQRLHVRGVYEGTGIGLTVCKRIIERHGGRIWAESVPGEGSQFIFTIPATADPV